MPSISNLDSRRSALTDGVGIGAGPIAGDDLHPRPIAEPGGNVCGLAIGQEIDYFVRLEIDQHGTVATPTSPRCQISSDDPTIMFQRAIKASSISGTEANGRL